MGYKDNTTFPTSTNPNSAENVSFFDVTSMDPHTAYFPYEFAKLKLKQGYESIPDVMENNN